HTTADDPTKYQPPAELEAWRQRDPITRYRKFLMDRTLLTDAQDEQLHDEVNAEFQAALDLYEVLPPPDPARQFDYTYAELPPQLQRQREEFLGF
ncbi:MAG: pyruvate dehydrogenase (acetyl-transferring) E1 component subunit alpha, partial [Anaerolineae bacterium]|nr:pyruvate dehydrogenase (acetyl-transferring) E1 component subunit alpha [Anaerolineae bacterium]